MKDKAFDLEVALRAWRSGVLTQPNLSAEICRELEAHVRDMMAELQQLGLSNEEAFIVACRRVGQPLALEGEFEKADPERARQSRLAHIGSAVLAIYLWLHFVVALLFPIWPVIDANYSTMDNVRFWVRQAALELILWGPVLWLVVSAVRGGGSAVWREMIFSRARFLGCACFLVVMTEGSELLMVERHLSGAELLIRVFNLWPVALLIAAVALILPMRKMRLRPLRLA